MRLGFGSWRLSSAAFWSMTPREVAAVLRAAAPATPDRGVLEALMRRFPDVAAPSADGRAPPPPDPAAPPAAHPGER
jgi:uncharacterized phage protein (TIGR02216 family)